MHPNATKATKKLWKDKNVVVTCDKKNLPYHHGLWFDMIFIQRGMCFLSRALVRGWKTYNSLDKTHIHPQALGNFMSTLELNAYFLKLFNAESLYPMLDDPMFALFAYHVAYYPDADTD